MFLKFQTINLRQVVMTNKGTKFNLKNVSEYV